MHLDQRDTRLVQPGHFVGLKFDGGWWFINALGTSQVELKPWILLNENGNRASIASATAGNEDQIQDSNARNLLEPNDSERSLVYQVLTGVAPSRMQLFPLFGRDQNLGLEQSISTAGDTTWITGFDSPYNNPSEQSEVFYINDMENFKLQAFNPMGEAKEARASFLVNQIRYGTVTDINLMKAMLQNQVRSRKHMMGLGPDDRHQLKPPDWLKEAFGDHIHTEQEILSEGDTTQASVGGRIQTEDAAVLESQ